jgi:hypothetical protein
MRRAFARRFRLIGQRARRFTDACPGIVDPRVTRDNESRRVNFAFLQATRPSLRAETKALSHMQQDEVTANEIVERGHIDQLLAFSRKELERLGA